MARSRMMRKTRKNPKQRGGATMGWQPDGRLAAEASYAMVNKMYDGCMNTARPGAMAFSMGSGLPGMRGGAYSVNPGSSLAPGRGRLPGVPVDDVPGPPFPRGDP